jgi:hypothetical protein
MILDKRKHPLLWRFMSWLCRCEVRMGPKLRGR